MSHKPTAKVEEMITPRAVRRYAKRKGLTEQQAFAELYNKVPAMPGDKSSLDLYVALRHTVRGAK